jgi:hypothetical protein
MSNEETAGETTEEIDETEEELDEEVEEGEEEITIDDDLDDAREAAAELAKLTESASPDVAQLVAAAKKLTSAFIAIDTELSNGGEYPVDWAEVDQ